METDTITYKAQFGRWQISWKLLDFTKIHILLILRCRYILAIFREIQKRRDVQLKSRFRCPRSVASNCMIVSSCVLLHNFLIENATFNDPTFFDDNIFDEHELDNCWINKNLQDYDVAEYYENYYFLDERITSRSTEAGEIKREIICSLLWNKKVLRTNLANFWKDVPRICNFINYFPKLILLFWLYL